MGEVIFPKHLITKLDLPPERVLQHALGARLKEVVIIGFDEDGDWYFASSIADGADTIYHCSKAIHKLHKMEDEMTE